VLSDTPRIRKEAFGAILQQGSSVYFLNAKATAILETLSVPVRLSDLLSRHQSECLSASAIMEYLQYLVAAGIAKHSDKPRSSPARIYEPLIEDGYCLSAPFGLEVEITNKCYRHCIYCAYESGPRPKICSSDELSTEQWISLIDEAESIGIIALEFTGGDPFTRPDCWDILRYAGSKGIMIYINSDLSCLTLKSVENLQNLKNLVSVQTSLDGSSPETCDFTRGKGSWKTVTEQIQFLASLGIPVSVGTTVHKRNFKEIKDIALLISSLGAASYYIGPMYPVGRGARLQGLVLSPEEWDFAVRLYIEALLEKVIPPADILWYEILANPREHNPVKDQMYITSRGNRTLRIDPTGAVYLSAKLRHWHPKFHTLGRISEITLQELWRNSPLLQELRTIPSKQNLFKGIDIRDIPGNLFGERNARANTLVFAPGTA